MLIYLNDRIKIFNFIKFNKKVFMYFYCFYLSKKLFSDTENIMIIKNQNLFERIVTLKKNMNYLNNIRFL